MGYRVSGAIPYISEIYSKLSGMVSGTNPARTVIQDATTGDPAAVNSDNQLAVEIPPLISVNNSTDTPLGIGATFTGTADILNGYGIIYVNTYSDQASAIDGLQVQQSSDGTNWDHCDEYTVPAAKGKNYSINPFARFLRIEYINGAVAQTEFRLQTILKASGKSSSHRVSDTIIDDDDAELVKAVISGSGPDGTFRNVNTTPDGYLAISDNSSGLSIAQGNVTGTDFIHKFGAAPAFGTADGFVTVWDGAESGEAYESMQYVYSATADIDYMSAEDNGDTQDVEVQGLDANYDLTVQTVTLTGQTPVALTTPLLRAFRLKNVGSTDFAAHVFCYVSAGTTVTNGVPQDGTKVRAIVHNGNNQTEMAVFTIPAGKTGYMRDWYANTAGARRDSSHTIRVLARPFGQVFQLKHTGNIDVNGTSYIKHDYTEPEVFGEKTDVEIRMDTNQNDAGVAAGFDIVLVNN